ncbi:MaoC family dehydratase [Ralstonia solanacearum]|nr:MaoC family dehydratase [Ralstonia solanacearum]
MTVLYLEDFTPGQRFAGHTRIRIEEARLKAFASEFDPQPFHLDEGAANASIFRGLAASGWHTAAVTMRLLVDSEFRPAGGIVGAGFDEVRWPQPTRPGDELRVESEVLEVRQSKSRPEQGLVKVRTNTLNQDGGIVQISVGNVVVPCRSASSGGPQHDISQRSKA